MKKIFLLIVLVSGTTGKLFAQLNQANAEKTFELPANNIKRIFLINLDKGNKMQIELTDINELQYLENVDSLVKVFIHDMLPLKDSLAGELFSRRIDYIIGSLTIKKIRIQKFQPKGSHFLVNNTEAASLKLEQDTITITGTVEKTVTRFIFRKQPELHYYRVSFFLNDLNDLAAYLDGRLNEKISSLKKNVNTNWISDKNGYHHLKKDPAITSPAAKGYVAGSDFLTLRLSIDAQNYKNYFVPSVSLGLAVVFNNNLVRREFGVGTEHHFSFMKNGGTGKLETLRNSFLTVSYGRVSVKDTDSKTNASLYPFISVGYLIKSRGNFYDKNTFKLGLGRFGFFGGTTKIEPTLYFNNFFKGVTPSLRITQSF